MKYCKVLSKKEFDNLIVDPEAIAIRIIDPENEAHSDITGYKDELKLTFWDTEKPIGRFTPISEYQAEQLYNFMYKYKEEQKLVVHCMAGMSRSNTIAQFFALHIAKDDYTASLLASIQGKMINYGVWDALKEQAIKNHHWYTPFGNT